MTLHELLELHRKGQSRHLRMTWRGLTAVQRETCEYLILRYRLIQGAVLKEYAQAIKSARPGSYEGAASCLD